MSEKRLHANTSACVPVVTLPNIKISEDKTDLFLLIEELSHTGRIFSDIHIEQDAQLMMKTPQGWREIAPEIITLTQMSPLLNAIDPDWEAKIMEGAIDRPLQLSSYFMRCNIYRHARSRKVAISMRSLPRKMCSIDDVGLPFYVRNLIQMARGIVLVSGPICSGKTTTITALLEHINATRNVHIVTIEAPIEYQMEAKVAIISQKEIPTDAASFVVGLREAMRQNSDVLMAGEIKDWETASAVLRAGESGRLVFASINAGSAASAIDNLLSFFPAEQRHQHAAILADSLAGVIFQNLLPAKCGEKFILASEMMFNNNQQVSTIVRDPRKLPLLVEYMSKKGDNLSYSLNTSLAELVKKKNVNMDDALRISYHRRELNEMLQRN